ncbi:hypothetical protein [Treponema parvum]|uniref:hypothetical protein n=1 Tax=Treponema parvum TaxID=138851 RepID=UPI001AEBD6EC|nr:hypothetical protein [Treponema parvum]QTQ16868.1 hypothetical protein HXT04_09300 [Treponema parvum]
MSEESFTPKKIEYESVNISDFFDGAQETPQETHIVVFTPKQRTMIESFLSRLEPIDKQRCRRIRERITDLELLVESFENFPSLLEKHELTADLRTPQILIDSLISNQNEGDQTLQLPSKATLGKGFLVAKIHTFSSLTSLTHRTPELQDLADDFQTETISMMFMLLAEDVYLNLIRDTSIPMEFRRHLSISLLLLWEHRNDQNISDIAPVLQSVWNARRKLAPAFGTMMGTSELLLMSIQMDSQWIQFIKKQLGTPEVSQAMEEFLFGISYEQIKTLRSILKNKGISAISRDEVSDFLGEHVKVDAGLDYRDFYSIYTLRRDNARARRRMHLEGPHKTLEDYFIQFVMELNREKQQNDSAAGR